VSDIPENPGSAEGGDESSLPETPSLRGRFLLASASLADPHFSKTVVLIVRHDEEGALGLVLNRPLGVTLDEACSDDVEAARGVGVALFHGGPCAGPLVAVHNVARLAQEEAELVEAIPDSFDDESTTGELTGKEPWAEPVTPGVWFCARREALEVLMHHVRESLEETDESPARTPVAVKFVAGYAGWGAGQLESELMEGSWLIADASLTDIYAGGSPGHPAPAPTTSLPPGAIHLVSLLANTLEGQHDPTPGLAAGIRQWVRLSTRANIGRMIDPKLIPTDPSAN
jgi:putative transcriptional regulator